MRDDEIREAGLLAGMALGEVSRGVHRTHGVIAGRVRDVLRRLAGSATEGGPPGTGPITSLTYAAVDLGLVTAGRVGGRLLARTYADDRAAADTVGRLLAVVNGTHGHLLHARSSPLALRSTIRSGRREVQLTAEGVRAAWPEAGDAVAVYLHGLVDTEERWTRTTAGTAAAQPAPSVPDEVGDPGPTLPTLPDRLARELGLAPVLVRYNSGRRIEDSAAGLSDLLDALVRAWPVPLTRIVLVGHSMGGLVARAALAAAILPPDDPARDHGWAGLVTDLVTIGSPHDGAWLEHVVDGLVPHLAALPETAWLAEQVGHRSDGVRDLGRMTTIGRAPIPAKVSERAVVGLLVGDRSGPVGRVVGDLMVGVESASGGLPAESIALIPAAHHVGLIADPRVGEQIVTWLTASPS